MSAQETSQNVDDLLGLGDDSRKKAEKLMMEFSTRTGLSSNLRPVRYLWTDAFAVCNFLGLEQASPGQGFLDLARRLVDSVHRTLGRQREDSGKRGWLSGLSEEEGAAHPTRGGLRIGKPGRERAPSEPHDTVLEWSSDGQYFHYLTRWMHALDRMSQVCAEPQFNMWARELARVACDAFTYRGVDGRTRMFWKMSIDLTRPLVSTMGHHDALDGYVSCCGLQTTASDSREPAIGPHLEREIETFFSMVEGMNWTTVDSLGIGGLLVDALRIAQLIERGRPIRERVLRDVLSGAATGLREYARHGETRQPAEGRLAFRELGLAIGIHAVKELPAIHSTGAVVALLDRVAPFLFLGEEIERFWLDPEHRQVSSWTEHEDINDVMLATCLEPAGYLGLVDNKSKG